jgi:hypothetical protein
MKRIKKDIVGAAVLTIFLFLNLASCGYKQRMRDSEPISHPLYRIIPHHRSQIYWYDAGHWAAWAIFGNDDDGIFGERAAILEWPEREIGGSRAFFWWCRNPFHNFTHYVIGSADKPNSQFIIFKAADGKICGFTFQREPLSIYAEKGSSFYFGLHRWKPFISLYLTYSKTYKGDFYIGWRPNGAFGIKAVPLGHRKH